MNQPRTFQTTAAERYDRSLHRSQALTSLPDHIVQPLCSAHWPKENIALLESYREWLVAGGAATAVINQHRIPTAGHFLGLALRPLSEIDIDATKAETMTYLRAKKKGEIWEKNCTHSLRWFVTFLTQTLGIPHWETPKSYGDIGRYQAGLPDWLLAVLTKQLQLLQGNWRRARQAEMTYQFWCKYTRPWRWFFELKLIDTAADLQRHHLFAFIDAMLADGYVARTINLWIYSLQSTLRFMDERRMGINRRLLMIPGLKVDDALPRFLTAAQVTKVSQGLEQRVAEAQTPVQIRNSRLDQALFTLLWQTGLRVSEAEDLTLNEIDLTGRRVIVRQAKGMKDRVVYLTDVVVNVLADYLDVRGPALSDHLFIYRHKQVSKDLVRLRVKAAGKRVGVYVTPHMLRHTFATQLLNSGCRVTSIQRLLGHKRLSTTMVYARVHDETLVKDYYQAMKRIEGNTPRPSPEFTSIDAWLEAFPVEEMLGSVENTLEYLRQVLVALEV